MLYLPHFIKVFLNQTTLILKILVPAQSYHTRNRAKLEQTLHWRRLKRLYRTYRVGNLQGRTASQLNFIKFFQIFLPQNCLVYKDALERGSLSDSIQIAVKTLIHKKDRDPQQCGNYCPVSQINIDAKLLSKILASRLECFFYQNLFTQIKWVLLRIGHYLIIYADCFISSQT